MRATGLPRIQSRGPLAKKTLTFIPCSTLRRSRTQTCGVLARQSVEDRLKQRDEDEVRLRAEAEAPFRLLRLTLFGFSVASAGMGTLISLPQLAGALGGAPNALATSQVLENLAVNLGAVGLFGFLFKQDWDARNRQLVRIGRETSLAALSLQLANGRRLRLGDLRSSARAVLVAGSPSQVAAALAAAEPFRGELVRRGVLVVPLPVYPEQQQQELGGSNAGPDEGALPPLSSADLRWRAGPLNLDAWRDWFTAQLAASSTASPERGLFVGLRLDGRVRSSGSGVPPWARYVAELAPLEGDKAWVGFMDGFDGRV